MNQDRPKVSLRKTAYSILSIVVLIGLSLGLISALSSRIHDVGRVFEILVAILLGTVVFCGHLDELINSKAPLFTLFLFFVSLSAWSVFIPFQAQGIWGGTMTALSLIFLFPLAEFLRNTRPMWYKTELFDPILWTGLLWVGYFDHLVEGPSRSWMEIVLMGVMGLSLFNLTVAAVRRMIWKWKGHLNSR